ncbi:MAG: hypothetical protein KFF68_11515, partial [Desulfosarcina sp.]|nr:hypothetical protein [Desulfosarcina sp.]
LLAQVASKDQIRAQMPVKIGNSLEGHVHDHFDVAIDFLTAAKGLAVTYTLRLLAPEVQIESFPQATEIYGATPFSAALCRIGRGCLAFKTGGMKKATPAVW